jgi:hypothetical protein
MGDVHMKQALIPFQTPENQDECNELCCDHGSIMYDTQHSATLPKCFYYAKSMQYLQMMEAAI